MTSTMYAHLQCIVFKLFFFKNQFFSLTYTAVDCNMIHIYICIFTIENLDTYKTHNYISSNQISHLGLFSFQRMACQKFS